ncbi:MAG: Mur ligase family protein [Candidatus Limnocylindria bacterium]
MPRDADPPDFDAELLELRVLDGPNRFFTRPAVKIEFVAQHTGAVEGIAAEAAEAIRRLHEALDLPAPRITHRPSMDGLRVAVAFTWRRRTIAQGIGASAARLALGRSTQRREVAGLRATALGPLSHLPRTRIPIVAVTGTNGKSTTTRLIAHIATGAGMKVGMTNSDGIVVRGEMVEAGDWTGFGGAARILSESGLDLAVLETARGGILLRGIGYAANDVSVVTNVSADHLGLQGIDTLDELAEVKGVVPRITRRDGWAVLNADDDRAWGMRRSTRAAIHGFSLEPDSERVRRTVAAGGRGAILRDGELVLLGAGRRARRLGVAAEMPVTVAGLSRYNIANALAAAAACDALGIPAPRIGRGLKSFAQDASANPGRLNVFEREGIYVIVDFAHNEAGLAGLLDVAEAVAGTSAVRLAFGTAGDRTDEILLALGRLAGRANDLVIAEKEHYLRGRDLEEMNELLRRGARDGGYRGEIEARPNEMEAFGALLGRARGGDVCAVMAHTERSEIFDRLAAEGFRPVGIAQLSGLVSA